MSPRGYGHHCREQLLVLVTGHSHITSRGHGHCVCDLFLPIFWFGKKEEEKEEERRKKKDEEEKGGGGARKRRRKGKRKT